MHPENDRADLARARTDPQAFAPIYERYFSDVFRFIHRRTGHRELSADLTQQTFLKALLALARYQERGLPFRAWLYRIALNELRMHWRKRKELVVDVQFAQLRELVDDLDPTTQEEGYRRVLELLGRQDESRQRLIELRYFDGLSFAELGQVLGIAEDAAKMRTHRVLRQLRAQLTTGR